MPFKILISDKVGAPCTEILDKAGYAYDILTGQDPQGLESVIGGYDAQVVRSSTKVTRGVLERGRAGRLKCVARAGAGLDNIDVAAAEALGVRVFNTPGLNSNAVAELTIALCLILARRLGPALASTKAGRWEKRSLSGTEISGKVMGLLGFGHAGRKVAAKALGLGMRVLAHDPLVPPGEIRALGAEPAPIPDIQANSDFLSLHLPRERATENIVDAAFLSRLKGTAYLVNCARGGLVDEGALYEALRGGVIQGAASDVFATEPPGSSPLLALPNFEATPHIGASTHEAQLGVAARAAELVVEFLGALG